MRLAVVGSRNFANKQMLYTVLDQYLEEDPSLVIISGGARGADNLAEDWAFNNKVECVVHPALWDKYGKQAGYLRNVTIWDDADEGVAFWDGESKGTKHSFTLAQKQQKQLIIVKCVGTDCEIYDGA